MKKRLAIEPQNQIQFDLFNKKGGVILGPFTSYIWRNDPKHLLFLLARYKFCAKFMANICKSLKNDAICIIGTPNSNASGYATEASKEGHANLKNYKQLKDLLKKYFINIFLFSMNDEVVHTGFYPMAHYLLAVGVGIKGNIKRDYE